MRQEEMIADRYRVVRPIGSGGMGTVWLGHDETLRRDVALKRIGVLPGEDSMGTARAMREARLSAALHHENAVSIFDVVEHDGSTWLVMEYVPSRTLATLVAEEGRLPPERVAHVGAQVARALLRAHELGIVHRDVKPGNILVGPGDLAKISDFGIARGDQDMQLTQTGLMTGTPGYFSPELARGAAPTAASDVWALGVTLYTAVEGDPPYPTQTNPLAMLSTITREPVPPPQHAGPLAPVLDGMLARDPEARWTMAFAAEALESCRRGDDPTRRLAPTPYLAGQDTSATVVAAAQPSYPAAEPAAGPVQEPRSSPPGRGGIPLGRLMAAAAAVLLLLVLGVAGWSTLGDDPEGTASDASEAGATEGGKGGDGQRTPDDGGGSTAPDDEDSPAAPEDEGADNSGSPGEGGSGESGSGESGSGNPESDEGSSPEVPSDPEAFTRTYFSTVPDDLDSGWRLIDPSMQQELGRDSYEEFWGSVESVRLLDVEATSDESVRYEVVYVFEGGERSQEVKELSLRPVGQSFRITDDTTVG